MQERWMSAIEASRALGVSSRTLRRWTANGRLPDRRVNGRRVFRREDIESIRTTGAPRDTGIVAYARVSSRQQEADLVRQTDALREAAGERLLSLHVDIASGVGEDRPGLEEALTEVTRGRADTLLVAHPDRLARFGVRIIEHQLSLAGVRVRYLAAEDVTIADPHTEKTLDVGAVAASVGGRLHVPQGGR